MRPSKPCSALCWLAVLFANTPWLTAFQDAPAGPQNAKKADAATDLAAGQAFLAVVRSHSYSVPEDKVREVVLAFLRKDTTQVPKSMPTVDQLQGDLDLDFEAAWTEMIQVAAAGLDPDGELGVANRLREHLVANPQLRSRTEEGVRRPAERRPSQDTGTSEGHTG